MLMLTVAAPLVCRYVTSFRGVGLLLARDLVHLDHQTLLGLGVTATGHRKRILRLVTHITQGVEPDVTTTSPPPPPPHRDRCQSVTALAVSVSLEALRNRSAPDLGAMLGPDNRAAPERPVPLPRTVFQRRRTSPLQAPPPPRRLSQEAPPLATPSPQSGGGAVPPVPPRMSHGPSLPPPPPLPLAPPPSGSPGGGGVEGGLQMVSNDLYWGASTGARGYCSQQVAPPTPPRQLDRKPERNR